MAYTLDQFCKDAHDALKNTPGRAGREKVRVQLEALLKDKEFVAATLGEDAPHGARVLYEDPELDFVVLGYVKDEGHSSPPHDHGPSWAIYGQAEAYTDQTEWRRVDGGDGAGDAKVEEVRSYRLTPGKAGLYDIGDIHSIAYPDGARYVRVTGTDLDHVRRLRFDTKANKAVVIESASASN